MTILFSVVVNLLMLITPLYMLQIYDRVLTSQSRATLWLLSILSVGLLSIYAFADTGRRRVLNIYIEQNSLDHFRTLTRLLLSKPQMSASARQASFFDIKRVQSFLTNGGILPLIDAVFSPLFFALLFILHPTLGIFAILVALILVALSLLSQRLTTNEFVQNEKAESVTEQHLKALSKAQNAIIGMGMRERVLNGVVGLKAKDGNNNTAIATFSSFLAGITRSFRMAMQILILGLGAYLHLQHELSAGGIIAGSIIFGRALAPLDQIVSSWRQIVLARSSWKQIQAMLNDQPETTDMGEPTRLQEISSGLATRNLIVAPLQMQRPILNPITMEIQLGQVVTIVGPSGSGKSTLLKTLIGSLPPRGGSITLGGRDISTWSDEDRGRFVGYLPQNIELLPGSVADNIKRFDGNLTDEDVVSIAKELHLHDVLSALPASYDTLISPDDAIMSPGQLQAVALVRAFITRPGLIVLDEPTAHLDARAATFFLKAFRQVAPKSAILISTHDTRVFGLSDHILSTDKGRLTPLNKDVGQSKVK